MHCMIGRSSPAECRDTVSETRGHRRLQPSRTWAAVTLAATLLGAPLGTGIAHAASVYPSNAPIVGIAATPDGKGYWEVASDGGIFAFGDAGFYGSMGGKPLNAGVVGIAATPDGKGYWEVASDGGVFAFGDAGFHGSMSGQSLNDPVTGIAAAPAGGYWLTAADGGVFAFGNAKFLGSMGGKDLAAATETITVAPNGNGYWLTAADGGIFAFGSATYEGRASYTPPQPPPSTIGQLAANLAAGWLGRDYHGINNDYWHAPTHPQYWCSDFATYVWQHAGVRVPTYPAVSSFLTWVRQNGRFSSDTSHLQVGDVIFYAQHVGVVIQVSANGTVTTADGDFGGTKGSEATFASSSHVKFDTFNPQHGQGAAGAIIGIGLMG